MKGVAIAGACMARFGRHADVSLTDLGAGVVLAALAQSQIRRQEIEAVYVGSSWGGSMIGQRVVREAGLPGIPVTNFENACSSGSTALHHACSAVAAGLLETVLVLGLDKLSFAGGTLPRHSDDYDGMLGLSAPALYAMRAGRYMHDYGATPHDLALVSVKNRSHAVHNEHAMFREPVSVEDVLGSRPVCTPLTLLQCCARSDGAAALVVTTETKARRRRARPIRIRASILCSGVYQPGYRDMTLPEITVRGAAMAYEQASLGPNDLDLAEVHDAFTVAELLYYEALGFCGRGEAVALLKSGATGLGGRLPVNTSGGLLSKGHPPGATGVAQVVEAVEQLEGRSGARQVESARMALTHCTGGGVSGLDHGACTIHIFEAT